jgi:hypothetical protein
MMKVMNVLFFGVMILLNYLANSLPINNKTTGELSGQYPNLFVPAGITFSIWGVIYLLLLVFIVMQFRESYKPIVASIGGAFAINTLLNASWIMAWHYERLPLSILIMLGILASLVYIGWKTEHLSFGLTKAAFGIYLGWICIATIANITAALVYYNWDGWGVSDQWWAVIMIGIGLLISIFALIRLENPFIGLAVIWAFTGIILARLHNNTIIVIAAFIAIGIMLAFVMWQFIHPASIKMMKI